MNIDEKWLKKRYFGKLDINWFHKQKTNDVKELFESAVEENRINFASFLIDRKMWTMPLSKFIDYHVYYAKKTVCFLHNKLSNKTLLYALKSLDFVNESLQSGKVERCNVPMIIYGSIRSLISPYPNDIIFITYVRSKFSDVNYVKNKERYVSILRYGLDMILEHNQ